MSEPYLGEPPSTACGSVSVTPSSPALHELFGLVTSGTFSPEKPLTTAACSRSAGTGGAELVQKEPGAGPAAGVGVVGPPPPPVARPAPRRGPARPPAPPPGGAGPP